MQSKFNFLSLCACVVINLFTPLAYAASDNSSTLESFFETLTSLHARFEQSLFDEDGDLYEESTGVLHIQRPGKFRWEYQQPYPQLLVSDGESIWIYEEDLEQVTVKPFNDSTANTPAVLLSQNQRIEDSFSIESLPSENGLTRFNLQPNNAEAQFERIELGFADGNLMRIKLHDNLGQTTLINLSEQHLNTSLDEALFIFTPPAGTDVNVLE